MISGLIKGGIVAVTLCGASLAAQSVSAHPHVFAEATLEVAVADDGVVQSLGHVWRFDEFFSSTVLIEFDANGDLKLDERELEEVGSVVKESIAEFGYFQFVTLNGKDVAMQAPDSMVATFDNEQLVIMFESHPASPLTLTGKVAFGVYDPTFYTAIEFIEDDTMTVRSLPAGCDSRVVRPDADEAIEQNQATLTEEFFTDPSGTDYSRIVATRLELTCAAEG